jgi:hypothetical protein
VNTSSGAGVKGFKDQAAYVAAKHRAMDERHAIKALLLP